MSKKIAVIGTGYVGLVTATCIAETGNYVTCVDNNSEKIKKLKEGNPIIYEPGLKQIFQKNIAKNHISFTEDVIHAVENNDIIFFALPTPMGKDFKADLSAIKTVCHQIKNSLSKFKIIITKSTVPVGTNQIIRDILSEGKNAQFDVVSNPEFLKEGSAINDFQKPDRIIIGTENERTKNEMLELYHPFVIQGNPIIFMSVESAEVSKYASNAFLATKISFMNELANFCEKVGADVDEVRKGLGTDPRIGNQFLYPGLGYGGSCFPKDVKAFIQTGVENNFDFELLNAVESINQKQKEKFFNKISKFFNNQFSNTNIAIWGLSFKANTDDIRESRSLYLLKKFLDLGANVKVFDPEALENTKNELGEMKNLTYCQDEYECVQNADVLIIATEWNIFRNPEWETLSTKMRKKVIFDGRNLFSKKLAEKYGFFYRSIGREKE